MKKDSFLSAMGDVDEKFIAEYEKAKKARRTKLVTRITAIAASVCLVISATAVSLPLLIKDKNISKAEEPLPLLQNTEPTASDATAPAEPGEPDEPTGPITVLSITPEKKNGDYVACDSDFIVEAENATADLVREHIYISGGPEYTVTEESEGKYRVSIEGSLSSGNVVSLSYANEGVTEYSWAFETERELEVITHTPGNNDSGVSVNTVIELELSIATDGCMGDYITFTPEISGTWESVAKLHRFIPDYPLSPDTTYTVTVSPGYSYGEYTMDEEYSFSFYTGKRPYIHSNKTPNLDNMTYFYPDEEICIRLYETYNIPSAVSGVTLYTFASAEDAAAYLDGHTELPVTEHSRPTYEYERLTEYTSEVRIGTLSTGYYLARIYEDGSAFPSHEAVLCINPINAYVSVTAEDILVWSDTPDLRVQYGDVSGVTGEDGIALLEDAADGTGKTGYVYLGEKEPLILAVPNCSDDSYPNGYIYTDKPFYKPDDTVHFWGAVPNGLISGDGGRAYKAELYNNGVMVDSMDVTPDEHGTFHGSFTFSDMLTGSGAVYLTYNGEHIGSHSFDFENYYLQNYYYDISYERYYVREGDSFDFDVTVTHVSGVTVSGKRIRANIAGQDFYALTDEYGTAHFSVPCPERDFGPFERYSNDQIHPVHIYIHNGDTEEESSADPVIHRQIYAVYSENDYIFTSSDGTYTVKGTYVKPELTDGMTDTPAESDFHEGEATFSGTVTYTLVTHNRVRTEPYVDPFTGKQYQRYEPADDESYTLDVIEFESVTEYTARAQAYTLPESTEYTCYSLQVDFRLTSEDGTVEMSDSSHILASNFYVTPGEPLNGYDRSAGTIVEQYQGYRINASEYSYYRYTLGIEKTSVNDGENVDISILNSLSGDTENEGTFLRVIYRNGVIEAEQVPVNEASFTYDAEEYGPFVKVSGAVFKDGRFYRLPAYTVRQNAAERTLTVTTETDKDSYAPGEQVTLTVSVRDSKGDPVSCAVNISAINKALFGEEGRDDTDRNEDGDATGIVNYILYSSQGYYPIYNFSTHHDRELLLYIGGSGGGDGYGEARVDFSDTACFETVVTDENGTAIVTFTLPEGVTTYRVTTHAAYNGELFGSRIDNISVNMDFFLQSEAPVGQKSTDDFSPYAIAFCDSNEMVNYTFTIKETGQSIDAYAFTGAAANVNFGKLKEGTYTLRIDATLGEYRDAIEIPFEVVSGAMYDAYTETLSAGQTLTVTPTALPVKIKLYSDTTEHYLQLLDYLSSLPSSRADALLSAALGNRLYSSLLCADNGVNHPYLPDDFITEDGALSMYSESSADLILTALCNYYTPFMKRTSVKDSRLSTDIYVRELLVKASLGNGVLDELKLMESSVAGDEQLTAVIGLSYAFLGDYDSASRMYALLPERSEIRGTNGLRAILATFIDRENASELISALIEEECEEFYLGFAVASYLQNRIDSASEPLDITLSVNGKTEKHTVLPLQVKTVTVMSADAEGSLTVTADGNEHIRCSVTYTDCEHMSSQDDYYVYLEGDLTKYGTAYLVFNADNFEGHQNYHVALPPAMRSNGDTFSVNGVYGSADKEQLNIHISSDCTGPVRIPLTVTRTGNYRIEPIRLTTEAGNHYYSNEIVFDIK